MQWLTDLQSSMRGPVLGFVFGYWQYFALAAILGGWGLLYQRARAERARLAAATDEGEVVANAAQDFDEGEPPSRTQFGRRGIGDEDASSAG